MAGRAGVALELDRFDELAQQVAGARQPAARGQVPDGGFLLCRRPARAARKAISDLLDLECQTVNGKTLGENIEGAKIYNADVIRTARESAVARAAGCGAARQPRARRRGDQAAAAEARLHQHTGRAVVFKDYDDLKARIDDPTSSRWTRTRCSCCRTPARSARRACRSGASCRSRRSCCKKGVRDMVRISDARMSGTRYGACVLHVVAGVLRRRPARAGARRRPDRARRGGAQARAQGERRRAGEAQGGVEAAARRTTRAATARYSREHITPGGQGLRFRFPASRRADARSRYAPLSTVTR